MTHVEDQRFRRWKAPSEHAFVRHILALSNSLHYLMILQGSGHGFVSFPCPWAGALTIPLQPDDACSGHQPLIPPRLLQAGFSSMRRRIDDILSRSCKQAATQPPSHCTEGVNKAIWGCLSSAVQLRESMLLYLNGASIHLVSYQHDDQSVCVCLHQLFLSPHLPASDFSGAQITFQPYPEFRCRC